MGFVVIPTSGQLQVPNSLQSFARIIVTPQANSSVTTIFTADGEPEAGIPDFGFIAWRYVFQGVNRYGRRVPVGLRQQFLMSDQPQLEFDRLLVVPRPGVDMNVSLRRTQI